MDTLSLALAYLSRGYVVIPVGKDKRPLIAWKQFQKEIPGPSLVKEWWAAHPEAQIGIVTGELSDVTVIDVEAEGNTDLFKDLDTYTVKTGGGGYHYYFEYEPEVGNAVRTLPFTDVRSEGGYVVASGSKTEKGEYTTVKDFKPMKMPDHIREIFTKKAVPFSPSVPQVGRDMTKPPEYEGAGEGGRNDSMTRYVGKVLATMAPMYWESLAWPLILEANKKNSPPLPEYEVKLIFKSISERELPRIGERRYGERRPLPTSLPNGAKAVGSTPDFSTPEDPKQVGDIITLEEAANTQVIDVDKVVSTGIGIFDEALVGGFSPGDLIIIAGRSGVGKTTLTQDLTASFLTAEHPVLWFSYEVMAVPLYRKFLEMSLPEECYQRLYVPAPPLISSIDDIIALIKKAKEQHGVKVIALDHIGFIDPDLGRHGNHALAVTHIVRSLKRLAVDEELFIILPVHVRKVDAQEPTLEDVRDSYGVVQEADAVFLIDRKRSSTQAEREQSYYSDHVRIMLAKNRKTGVSKSGTFSLLNGRFAYQEGLSMEDDRPEMSWREKKAARSEVDKQWEAMTKDD